MNPFYSIGGETAGSLPVGRGRYTPDGIPNKLQNGLLLRRVLSWPELHAFGEVASVQPHRRQHLLGCINREIFGATYITKYLSTTAQLSSHDCKQPSSFHARLTPPATGELWCQTSKMSVPKVERMPYPREGNPVATSACCRLQLA